MTDFRGRQRFIASGLLIKIALRPDWQKLLIRLTLKTLSEFLHRKPIWFIALGELGELISKVPQAPPLSLIDVVESVGGGAIPK